MNEERDYGPCRLSFNAVDPPPVIILFFFFVYVCVCVCV